MTESKSQFKARILTITGKTHQQIKHVRADGVLPGAILAKRNVEFLCGVGYPEVNEETGEETYSEFVIAHIGDANKPLTPEQLEALKEAQKHTHAGKKRAREAVWYAKYQEEQEAQQAARRESILARWAARAAARKAK
jgi:hypothetical protein